MRASRVRRPKSVFAIAIVLAVSVLAPTVAVAKSVFLNGVNIDGVTDQKFDNVTVVIDGEGNVLITAKGYEVQAQSPVDRPPPVAQGPVTRRYFLVAETNAPGMVQYDVDVFVNAVWVKRISSDDPQLVHELTKHMKKGKNVVHFTATKNLGEGRRSGATTHYLKVIVGEGNVGGNNVMIDNSIFEYKRTAAEVRNFSNDFEVVGR